MMNFLNFPKWIRENWKTLFSGVGNKIVYAILAAVLMVLVIVYMWLVPKLPRIGKHLVSDVSISYWLLYLFLGFSCIGIILLILRPIKFLFRDNIPKSNIEKAPKHYIYVKDVFFNLIWRWKWDKNTPVDIASFCPTCDTRLVEKNIDPYFPEEAGKYLSCETCGGGGWDYLSYDVAERQIERCINTGEWKNASARIKQRRTKARRAKEAKDAVYEDDIPY